MGALGVFQRDALRRSGWSMEMNCCGLCISLMDGIVVVVQHSHLALGTDLSLLTGAYKCRMKSNDCNSVSLPTILQIPNLFVPACAGPRRSLDHGEVEKEDLHWGKRDCATNPTGLGLGSC